jgi:hypothetical protein
MNDYSSALAVMKSYLIFNDSLSEESRSSTIQQMLLKSKDIERQIELKEMEADRDLTELNSRMQTVQSYALFVGAVIMLIVSYIVIRR